MEPGQDDQRGPKNYTSVLLESIARGDAPGDATLEGDASGSRDAGAVSSAPPGLTNFGPQFYEKYKEEIEEMDVDFIQFQTNFM